MKRNQKIKKKKKIEKKDREKQIKKKRKMLPVFPALHLIFVFQHQMYQHQEILVHYPSIFNSNSRQKKKLKLKYKSMKNP